MLATSSSDDDEYDKKKPTPKPASATATNPNTTNSKQATFLSPTHNQKNNGFGVGSANNNANANNLNHAANANSNYYSQPNTPNMSGYRNNANSSMTNAMANVTLNGGGGDNASMRSSFSASSENLSLSNFQGNNSNGPVPPNRNLLMKNLQNGGRNASFKSNSSASTMGGAGGSLAPNTPRGGPRHNATGNSRNNIMPGSMTTGPQRRQMPKRPGDSTSFNSKFTVNGDNSSDDELNSEYNYETTANTGLGNAK